MVFSSYIQVWCGFTPSPLPEGEGWGEASDRTILPVVYVPAAGKRHYVIHITLNCFLMLPKARSFAIMSDIEHFEL